MSSNVETAGDVHLDRLILTINGVVTAEFEISLTPLERILRDCDDVQIETWTVIKSCQIESLLTRLTEISVQKDGACLVLMKFIQFPLVRDRLARLDVQRIQAATDAILQREQNSKTLTACSLILLRAQNHWTALSQRLIELLSSIFNNVYNLCDMDWANCLVRILPQIHPEVLNLISNDAIDYAGKRWKEFLRSKDHMLALSAASMAADLLNSDKLQSPTIPAYLVGLDTDDPSSNMKVWMKRAELLFVGERTLSIVSSTVLRVVYFCTDQCSKDAQHFCQIIQMAINVIDGLEPPIIAHWQSKNGEILRKLVQKILHVADNVTVQCLGLLFIRKFDHCLCWHDVQQLGWNILSKILSHDPLILMCSLDKSAVIEVVFALTIYRSEPDTSNSSNSNYISHQLKPIISFLRKCCDAKQDNSFKALQARSWALAIVDNWKLLLDQPQSRTMVCSLLDMFDNEHFQLLERQALQHTQSIVNCGGLLCCTNLQEYERQCLVQDLAVLKLHAICSIAGPVNVSSFNALINIVKVTASEKSPECAFPRTYHYMRDHIEMQDRINIFHDGEHNIELDLGTLAKNVNDIIHKHIAINCHDLQKRCNTVEEPLRNLQKEVTMLEIELERTRSEMSELYDSNQNLQKAQSEARDGEASALRTLSEIQVQISDLKHRHEELQHQYNSAIEGLDEAKEDFEKELNRCQHQAQDDIDDITLGHKAEILALEDQLEQQCLQISSVQQELVELQWTWNETEHALLRSKQALAESNDARTEEAQRHDQHLQEQISETKRLNRNLSEYKETIGSLEQLCAEQQNQLKLKDLQINDHKHSAEHWQTQARLYEEQLKQAKFIEKKIVSMLGMSTDARTRVGETPCKDANAIPSTRSNQFPTQPQLPSSFFSEIDLHITPLKY